MITKEDRDKIIEWVEQMNHDIDDERIYTVGRLDFKHFLSLAQEDELSDLDTVLDGLRIPTQEDEWTEQPDGFPIEDEPLWWEKLSPASKEYQYQKARHEALTQEDEPKVCECGADMEWGYRTVPLVMHYGKTWNCPDCPRVEVE